MLGAPIPLASDMPYQKQVSSETSQSECCRRSYKPKGYH